MLTIAICKKCPRFEATVSSNSILCTTDKSTAQTVYLFNKPPDFCPFLLEHIINEPNEIIRNGIPELKEILLKQSYTSPWRYLTK